MNKYALAYFVEEKRCLVSISRNMIAFNISGFMTFKTHEEAETFVNRWQHHFFDVKKLLTIIEVKENQ